MGYLHTNEKYFSDFVQSIHKLTRIPLDKLEEYGKVNNLINVLEHPRVLEPTVAQFQKIEQLNAFLRAYRVVKWEEENARQCIRSPQQAGDYFSTLLEGVRDRERFMVAFLNNSNRIIETRTISEGSIDQAPVYPRDILKPALNCDCSSLIFAHNHPGGTLSPSPEDVQLTRRMVDIFNPLNIQVLDHIIIAGNGYLSMAEMGKLPSVAERTANYESISLPVMEQSDYPYETLHSSDEIDDEWER
ncbi:DNA repair protein [Xylanibacillus composti]|uniref:MPN domain-containing protein n=1 Tax=Xylanibacillus composti TaxID=1572762 RepID=A0A8J4H2M4_9BACL|nr:JAB domain-containing protein [Xylanibacillus composti]MDT9723623.1 DNA repair protein [Xylanibacillus composti]GIQ68336.1 hypothetical protein XYCOK13_11600 [Xylanibacillus composti]